MTSTTALVTGANKGIGKEIARQLVSAGFTVYLGSRDAARGRAAAEEIGGDCHLVELDVTDEKSIAAAAASIASLDVLINNAGVLVDSDTGPDASLSSFRATYETNVFGVVAVTNAFLPALRRSPAPRIVNISSGTASLGASTDEAVRASATGAPAVLSPGAVSYRSSKAALNMITALYAQALPGFRVNAMAPGLRATDLNGRARSLGDDPAEAAEGAVRLARLDDDGPTGTFVSWDLSVMPW
ncbi:SDR family NAD(P)-dependent oxidoreductase [Kineosporia succinea]|uniref:NAD(P)-dependent dehydrogenase (Short-subunit alcohol dehydrogenase family) n=1 Tax=Kineosporia succinea TaxID=84632 RepID=A0ABT9P9Y7_9ACTN|nr:SDR family NAD(P)-dependent oxidoreductase [Kineosporia succinea]MDP9829508.1 NAD(P)-dependent dehydrogenase (short-subunit alcohol dehydrogenase family) [Kineosporia succinea]